MKQRDEKQVHPDQEEAGGEVTTECHPLPDRLQRILKSSGLWTGHVPNFLGSTRAINYAQTSMIDADLHSRCPAAT